MDSKQVEQLFLVMTWVMYETKTLISIYHLYRLESFPKGIERYWFMGSWAKKKVYDFQKLKTF